MKGLTIITLAALLLPSSAHAELSGSEAVRLLVSRPARFLPVELPRNTPDFGASLSAKKLRANWTRPVDLVHNTETSALSKVFAIKSGALLYLLALTLIVYVRQARARGARSVPGVMPARPTPDSPSTPRSTPRR